MFDNSQQQNNQRLQFKSHFFITLSTVTLLMTILMTAVSSFAYSASPGTSYKTRNYLQSYMVGPDKISIVKIIQVRGPYSFDAGRDFFSPTGKSSAVIVKTSEEFFKGLPNKDLIFNEDLKVQSANDEPPRLGNWSKLLDLTFTLSGSTETIDKKNVFLGSLTLQQTRYASDVGAPTYIPVYSIPSSPFVISGDETEMEERVKQATLVLLRYSFCKSGISAIGSCQQQKKSYDIRGIPILDPMKIQK